MSVFRVFGSSSSFLSAYIMKSISIEVRINLVPIREIEAVMQFYKLKDNFNSLRLVNCRKAVMVSATKNTAYALVS